jgi:peptidoglycan/LPS O-acetylase OafA/YrhL
MLLYVIARGFAASDASPQLALASYLFIPFARPSGFVGPLYGLGWTLNYEMMFYLIFACALFARRETAVAIVCAVLVGMAIVHLLAPRLPDAIAFWSDPIILEFVFGMGLALLYRAGVRLPRTACYALLVGAAAVFIWMLSPNPQPRWIVWGLPAAMAVAAVALADRSASVPKVAVQLGDASYALYLIHPAINVVTRHAAWQGLFLQPATTPWLYLVATLFLSILAAFAVYYLAERPVSDFLKRKVRVVQVRPAG